MTDKPKTLQEFADLASEVLSQCKPLGDPEAMAKMHGLPALPNGLIDYGAVMRKAREERDTFAAAPETTSRADLGGGDPETWGAPLDEHGNRQRRTPIDTKALVKEGEWWKAKWEAEREAK